MECCELDEMLERIKKEVQSASKVDRILSVICYEPWKIIGNSFAKSYRQGWGEDLDHEPVELR